MKIWWFNISNFNIKKLDKSYILFSYANQFWIFSFEFNYLLEICFSLQGYSNDLILGILFYFDVFYLTALLIDDCNNKHQIFASSDHEGIGTFRKRVIKEILCLKMNFFDATAIFWSCLTLPISLPLWTTIYKIISEKAPIEQTIVNLIYLDCIIYFYLANWSMGIAFTGCILFHEYKMDSSLATLLSSSIYFWLTCGFTSLSISSCLRLISIVKKSEEAGIQLLGLNLTYLYVYCS